MKGAPARKPLVAAVVALAALAALAAGPAAARAEHPVAVSSDLSGLELGLTEAELLGPEHAAEHERMRAAAAQAEPASGPGTQPGVTPANKWKGGAPDEVGRWSKAYFRLPNFAIHAAVTATGEVMFWGYPPYGPDGEGGYTRGNQGLAAIWDPRKGANSRAITTIPPPRFADWDGDGKKDPTPVYCSGMNQLANGEILIAGGNLTWPEQSPDYSGFAGIKTLFTFDPWKNRWTRQPDMSVGRWYPTQVTLADGRTLIASGWSEQAPGQEGTKVTEIFTPGNARGSQGDVVRPGDAASDWKAAGPPALYPHMFTLPDGNVGLYGPEYGAHRRVFDTTTNTWTNSFGTNMRSRTGGTAVLDPQGPFGSWRVIQLGGFAEGVASETTEVFDFSDRSGDPQAWKPLVVPRSYHNTVLLPDGSMVTVGGGTGFDSAEGSWVTDRTARRRRVEVYDRATGAWRLGPSQREDRSYHSTAVLLPDGRVWSAGDDHHPYMGGVQEPTGPGDYSNYDTAEIYKPAYLFQGKRPKILGASKRVGYGDRFGVRIKGHRGKRAVLVAPSATTHANDMHQRLVPLRVAGRRPGRGLNLISPPNANVAPPGYYMLFVLHGGVPSKARWVRLVPGADGDTLGAL